jgi:F-type H+-transporting ATPase subunit delta
MQPKLEGFAAALFEEMSASDLATLASELVAFERAILTESALRGVLSDTSLNAALRGSVVRTLLENKVGADTLRLAVYTAAHVPAQEVPHAFSELVSMVTVRIDFGTNDMALLGLRAARLRIAGVADAILEGIAVADFAQIEEDLFRWARVIEQNPDLRRTLVDRDAALASRIGLVDSLLGGKVTAVAQRLARFVVSAGRARDVVGSLDYLVDYVARARDWRVARVHTARDLDAASEAQLAAALATLTGKNVELQVASDATLLGGVVVEVGDLRLDASTKGRLGALHDALMSGRALESVLND